MHDRVPAAGGLAEVAAGIGVDCVSIIARFDACRNNCTVTVTRTEYRQRLSGTVGANECNAWRSWMDGISANRTYSRIRFGAEGRGEFVCNGANANTLCQSLRTRTARNIDCNGRRWNLTAGCTANNGAAGTGAFVLHVDENRSCSCNTGSVLRPCSYNNNWGGFSSGTCGTGAQTNYVSCE